MNVVNSLNPAAAALDGASLPGWVYHDPEYLHAEKERVFAASWPMVCHLTLATASDTSG